MNKFVNYAIPYVVDNQYQKRVAYFSMEFAIDQCLKIYSGGLGYLAGSHLRSAYEARQGLIGIGIRWKNGYYDQVRQEDQTMNVLFQEKIYNFLEDTNIRFTIEVHSHPVHVKVEYLAPEIFQTAPLFLMTTDIPENDHLSKTICYRLYDNNIQTKIAQSILLGIGGAKLLDIIGFNADFYHLNEAHALPAAFYLYQKYNESLPKVREKLVFTTHTPVEAGNEKHDINVLTKMGFFGGVPKSEVRALTGTDTDTFNHTLSALRMAKKANGVSQMHGEVANEMWKRYEGICPIVAITNAQNKKYWSDPMLEAAARANDDAKLASRKKEGKKELFKIVADQSGKLFDPNTLTIVWSRRFADYKRADLIARDVAAFERLLKNPKYPVQIIWAGKPYPLDYSAVQIFNELVRLTKRYPNTTILTGYELALSKALKLGADIWLNTPRVTREASGTSGMAAAMNGAVNFSTNDGWIPEFASPRENAFIIPPTDLTKPLWLQDELDRQNLYQILEQQIFPLYYDQPHLWLRIVKNSLKDVTPAFESRRMVNEYYKIMYV